MGVYSRPWSVKEGDVWLSPPMLKHWTGYSVWDFSLPAWRLSQARDNSQKARHLQPPLFKGKGSESVLAWSLEQHPGRAEAGQKNISRGYFQGLLFMLCLGERMEDGLQNPISKHQWCNRINLWTCGVRRRFLGCQWYLNISYQGWHLWCQGPVQGAPSTIQLHQAVSVSQMQEPCMCIPLADY